MSFYFLDTDEIVPAEYDFTLDRLFYDDLVIKEFVDEEVGTKYCNGYAIVIPGVDVRDVSRLKARIIGRDSNKIEVTCVAARHGFQNHSSEWIGTLESVQKKVHANKLVKTLLSMVTHVKKRKENTLKKIVVTFPDELSNEYFSPGAPDGQLTILPLPYMFEHESHSKRTGRTTKFKSTEATVLWRAFIVDSDRDIEEVAGADDDIMDQMADMLGNL